MRLRSHYPFHRQEIVKENGTPFIYKQTHIAPILIKVKTDRCLSKQFADQGHYLSFYQLLEPIDWAIASAAVKLFTPSKYPANTTNTRQCAEHQILKIVFSIGDRSRCRKSI